VKCLAAQSAGCQTGRQGWRAWGVSPMRLFGSDSVVRSWLSTEKWVLAGLLIFTLLVRGSVLWVMRANLQQDPDAYGEIAENLLRYGEFALGKPTSADVDYQSRPTAYRPPLYPVVLSNLPTADGQHVSLVKVAALHLLLGIAT